MIDQQELHRRLLRGDGVGRFREDFHAFGDRGRACRYRFRRLFDLDQAHAAIGGDAEFFVVTETRDVGPYPIGYFDDHLSSASLDRLAIDLDVDDVVAHDTYAAASVALSTMLRPPLRTMYSNSWWK